MAETIYGIKDNKCLVPIEMGGGGGGAEIEVGTYTGNGAVTQTINLGYAPRFVFIFTNSKPFIQISSGMAHNIYSGALGTPGASKGVFADPTGFKVQQHANNPPDGLKAQLNASGLKYIYIAIK